MLGSRTPNKCVRNVASLQYRLYVILCVMLIKWLGCEKKWVYGILLGAPRTEKVIVLEQTKIGSFSDGTRQEHPTKFFAKILRLKQKRKILCK